MSTKALVFKIVGVFISISTIVIGGLQLRKMYLARKKSKEKRETRREIVEMVECNREKSILETLRRYNRWI